MSLTDMRAALSASGQFVQFDYADFSTSAELLARTADEMSRQVQLWGEQKHPLVNRKHLVLGREWHERQAAIIKEHNSNLAAGKKESWDFILLEEVYEAGAEDDPEKAITELVQVAAVALSAAKSIARYGLDGGK